ENRGTTERVAIDAIDLFTQMKLETAPASFRGFLELDVAQTKFGKLLPTANRPYLIGASRRRDDGSARGIRYRDLATFASPEERMAHVVARGDGIVELHLVVGVDGEDEEIAIPIAGNDKRDGLTQGVRRLGKFDTHFNCIRGPGALSGGSARSSDQRQMRHDCATTLQAL